MDNVIQYIGLSELIPGEFHPHLETSNDNLENLTNSIKNYGILEPLIVRPKDKRFEIILGNRRYKAASSLGMEKVPVIILNIDDTKALELVISDNIQRKELSSKEEAYLYEKALSYPNTNKEKLSIDLGIPLDRITSKLNLLNKNKQNEINKVMQSNISTSSYNTQNNSINNDIINLSELNQKETEREDFYMNNNQYENINMNNNNFSNQGTQQTSQPEPTFGGRFFPSLEDEPTNMNLNSNMNIQSPTLTSSGFNSSPLIDLTDLSSDKTQNPSVSQDPTNQSISLPNLDNSSPISLDQLNITPTPLPENQNINLSQPKEESLNINPISNQSNNQPIDLNQNINLSQPKEESLNINPIPNQLNNQPIDLNQNIPSQPEPVNNMLNNFNLGNSKIDVQQSIEPQTPNIPQMPNIEQITAENTTNQEQFYQPNNTNPIPNATNLEPISNTPKKDIIPVANMIKNLAIGIGEFGYKINITENDSNNSYSITIEVEK